jgi:hypothetical protein
VAVVADADGFIAQGDEALDVVGVGRQSGKAGRGEDDDFAAVRLSEVVDEAIDEQMVAADHFEANDVFAGAEGLAIAEFGAARETVGREPDGVKFVADPEPLFADQRQDALGLLIDPAERPAWRATTW